MFLSVSAIHRSVAEPGSEESTFPHNDAAMSTVEGRIAATEGYGPAAAESPAHWSVTGQRLDFDWTVPGSRRRRTVHIRAAGMTCLATRGCPPQTLRTPDTYVDSCHLVEGKQSDVFVRTDSEFAD